MNIMIAMGAHRNATQPNELPRRMEKSWGRFLRWTNTGNNALLIANTVSCEGNVIRLAAKQKPATEPEGNVDANTRSIIKYPVVVAAQTTFAESDLKKAQDSLA